MAWFNIAYEDAGGQVGTIITEAETQEDATEQFKARHHEGDGFKFIDAWARPDFVPVESRTDGPGADPTPEQWEMNLYETAVEKFGRKAQILMAVEEMSELSKALLKFIRFEDFGQGRKEDVLKSVDEERADVSIMLNQLDVIFGDNSEMECRKLDHLVEILGKSVAEAEDGKV